jgi:hypothetical protein
MLAKLIDYRFLAGAVDDDDDINLRPGAGNPTSRRV